MEYRYGVPFREAKTKMADGKLDKEPPPYLAKMGGG